MRILSLCLGMFLLTGCAIFAHKDVSTTGGLNAVRINTGFDPSTGQFFPSLTMGFGNYFYRSEIPVKGSFYYYSSEDSSVWNWLNALTGQEAKLSSKTTLVVYHGTGDLAYDKKLIVELGKTFNIPGLTVLTESAGTSITVNGEPVAPVSEQVKK